MKRKFSHKVALLVVGFSILLLLIILPFALKDIVTDLMHKSHPLYWLSPKNQPQTDNHLALNLEIISIDEWKGSARIRVTAYDYCIQPCNWTDEITLVSFFEEPGRENLAPAQTIQFSANHWSFTKEIELPVLGDPIRYPFDDFAMKLGVLFHRLYPNGRVETITPEMAKTQLSVAVQSRDPKFVMLPPEIINNLEVPIYNNYPQRYDYAANIFFERHSYLKVLTVFLVILIAVVAIYGLFICDVKSLVLGAGGIVLGVWGIKAILLSDSHEGITASDVILATLVLFILMAILIRAAFAADLGHMLSSFFHSFKKKKVDK